MKLSEQQVKAIKRKRGELNLTTNALANETGVSRYTLSAIINHDRRKVQERTFLKLNDWLIDQYTSLKQQLSHKKASKQNKKSSLKEVEK